MLGKVIRFFNETRMERALRVADELSDDDPRNTLAFYDEIYSGKDYSGFVDELSNKDQALIRQWMRVTSGAPVSKAYELPKLSEKDQLQIDKWMAVSNSLPLDYVHQPGLIEGFLTSLTRWNDARYQRDLEYRLQVSLGERGTWYEPITERLERLKFWK
jgi:hypothetical protein